MRTTQLLLFFTLWLLSRFWILNPSTVKGGKKIKTDFLACEIAKFHPRMLVENFLKLLA